MSDGFTMQGTYSPEDNKLRLHSATRLDAETYAKVRAAGFIWAPKQGFFVAPMWTPSRADLLTELCGEIGDEDSTLVDRAEQRAERFEDYSEARAQDADDARKAVHAIADNIPFGQPILVGHHSEKHARKDAEKIENGMRRAVKMWETSEYWKDRAQGAIAHAKYKERPDVRARRIKGLEADQRKHQREKAEAERCNRLWANLHDDTKWKLKPDGTTSTPWDRARYIANFYDHVSACFPVDKYPRKRADASTYEGMTSLWSALDGIIDENQAAAIATRAHVGTIAWHDRWLSHIGFRLDYERAMMGESGGTVADRTKPEVGGAVRCWASPGYGKGWAYIQKVNKVSVTIYEKASYSDRFFRNNIPFDKLKAVMSAAQVQEKRDTEQLIESHTRINGVMIGFYLRDEAPAPTPAKSPEPEAAPAAGEQTATPEDFEKMRETLKAGVQVVSAPQLFPTPPDLARRMAQLAKINGGERVLEPSAGTGNLIQAIHGQATGADNVRVVAIESSPQVAEILRQRRQKTLYANESNYEIRCADFLECVNERKFDAVVMNPPFANADDIKHIKHALTFLKPGGRLVAICANGPRQNDQLRPLVEQYGGTWEALPEGTFKEQGTNVNTVLLSMQTPKESEPKRAEGPRETGNLFAV